MEREIGRYRCTGDDGSTVEVVEYQHFSRRDTGARVRCYPGARRLALATGEPVRCVGDNTFEVLATGELIR